MTNNRPLTCCCCGNYAGKWAQHWNRESGFGICRKCIDWLLSRGDAASEIADLYGVEGINFAPSDNASKEV